MRCADLICALIGHRVIVDPWKPKRHGGFYRRVWCSRCDETHLYQHRTAVPEGEAMAKYDHGGGCACGLKKTCTCNTATPSVSTPAAPAVRQGWQCPVCGRGLSPDVTSCDHGQPAPITIAPTVPTVPDVPVIPVVPPLVPIYPPVDRPWPDQWTVGSFPACAKSGVCMCTRFSPRARF